MPEPATHAQVSTAAGDLVQRIVAGDRRALARAITLTEDQDPSCAGLLGTVFKWTGRARPVGLTGQPGVGKSTLINALINAPIGAERQRGQEVAVLSIDPSSNHSGALLGDRLRMSDHFVDPHVFIRSTASRDTSQGTAHPA
ncbi:MAG: hypothetical protein GEV07_29770 [Streptosporangiales bacterium]|nr:hypothetical protein [Streptosporangiales bacterium]